MPPFICQAIEGASMAGMLWRQRGELRATIAVKGVFRMVPEQAMVLAPPEPLLRVDTHIDDSPARSVRQSAELVPHRPRVDITAHACAYPSGHGGTAGSVRLAVYRGQQPLMDKTLHVLGEREVHPDGTHGPPAVFKRLRLTYEHAIRSRHNPHGVNPTQTAPRVLDGRGPKRVAGGLGPISRYAMARAECLEGADRRALEAAVAELPERFDGTYFLASPVDQQLLRLAGDEWVILDGMNPSHRRFRSQLPRARGEACVVAASAEAATGIGAPRALQYHRINLVADGLHIDAEADTVSVVWRGHLRLPNEDTLDALRFIGAVALNDTPVPWPDPRTLTSLAAHKEVEQPSPFLADQSGRSTTHQGSVAARGPALPFQLGNPPARRAASPWGRVAKPVPQRIGSGVVTYADMRGATITVTPEQRAAGREASAPFPLAPSESAGPKMQETTAALSDAEAARAVIAAAETPFMLARPGEGQPTAAPVAPIWAQPTPPVPAPIGDSTLDLRPERDGFESQSSSAGSETDTASQTPVTRPIPMRTTEAVPLVNSSHLQFVALPWQHRPPRDALTIIAKGSYRLVDNQRAEPLEESAPLSGDQHFDETPARSIRYPSDFAHFKPRADVVLLGHVYAPRGSAPSALARFSFGRGDAGFERCIAAFGDREWRRSLVTRDPTTPERFDKLPLVYELAFGGGGCEANPIGRGVEGGRGTDGVARLPNLEDPEHLITSPADAPAPACFAPIPTGWPVRHRQHGSFDRHWLGKRWPYFPDDFDWLHYQCAPRPQQLESIAGDEPFALAGMTANGQTVEGQLPSITPRCFLVTSGNDVGAELAFEEVDLRLDTVVFDVDERELHLVWRGVVEVSDEHAPEVETFYLKTDGPDERTSTEDAYKELLAAVAIAPVVEPESPDGQPAVANDTVPEPLEEEVDDELAALEKELAERRAEQEARLKEAGIDPEAPPPELPTVDPEELAKTLRAAAVSEEEIAATLAALQAEPETEDEVVAEPSPRERAEALLASGASFDGEDFSGVDLSDLDFSGCSMRGCNLMEATLCRSHFVNANLTGAVLARADVEGADLSGAHLARADFAKATLTSTVFDGAQLDHMSAKGASGVGASFRGAKGEGARLTAGTWDNARFDGAQLPRLNITAASFTDAVFDGAELARARLFDASGSGASFEGAVLTDAVCDGIDLTGANLFKLSASGSIWEAATLDDASFLRARLDKTSFFRASLERADLSAADLRQARMKRLRAGHALFVKANLMEAQLERSDLINTNFTGANLYGAELWKAKLRGAVFDEALTGQTKLEKRT